MYFKDKAYYVNKTKNGLGLFATAIILDVIIALSVILVV